MTCKSNSITIWSLRFGLCAGGLLMAVNYEYMDNLIENLWRFCLSSTIFNCVYFETLWVTFIYGVFLQLPKIASFFSCFDQYKISTKQVQWDHKGFRRGFLEIFWYIFPLMVLDTFMVKKYPGVDLTVIQMQKKNWLQKTRSLPQLPPKLYEIAYQIIAAFILYDALFYILHVSLHKNKWLFSHLHAHHHQHVKFSGKVTNQLTIVERLLLILSANEALKFVSAHPLSRTLFVLCLIFSLIENHCGYDLPFTLDKILPFRIYGGARAHYDHHLHGDKNYEPFFTYLDKYITPKLC
ncbi:unnamed protein product [Dimorphilus gyrociliatus]|uniref:Fatty acid hydroxylase domain-containing protein n=1 Tax=Dimorphilus gyrociliatus TaxID=2664684 RepID=A0A7I8V6J7_9ANNE|nr:unnamed protein product [Dimorphilus gyrociliatus]